MIDRTIMAVVAHPDDVELSCGGAIARWTREGDRAILVVATNGALGGKFRDVEPAGVIRQRAQEQREAAALLGVAEIVTLDFADGTLENDEALRGALVEQIRHWQPDVAVFLDPLTVIYRDYYVNHRDHRMLGMAMLDAMYPEASNAGYFPEQLDRGLPLHKVPETLLANTNQPNYWVDVSDTLDVRFDALRCHRSQIRLWPEEGEAVIRQQTELAGLLGLSRGVRYVEEYRRVVVNPLS